MVSRFPVPFGFGGTLVRDPFRDLHREMNRLFEDALGGTQGSGGAALFAPRIDIHDRDNAIEVTAELPGVTEDDIDLRIEGDLLTLRGEKRNERKDEQAHVVERSYGSFQRTVQLPFMPDRDKVRADFTDGVLTITLPKSDQEERSHRIQIRKGESKGAGQQVIEGESSPSVPDDAGQKAESAGEGKDSR